MAAMVEVGLYGQVPDDDLTRMAAPDEFSADEVRATLMLTRRAAEAQSWLAHDLVTRTWRVPLDQPPGPHLTAPTTSDHRTVPPAPSPRPAPLPDRHPPRRRLERHQDLGRPPPQPEPDPPSEPDPNADLPPLEMSRLRETIEVLSDTEAVRALSDTEDVLVGIDAICDLVAQRVAREAT
ncbi:MAG: hypothetical protein ACT4NY_30760 [Pseudonocardiales bacterium]